MTVNSVDVTDSLNRKNDSFFVLRPLLKVNKSNHSGPDLKSRSDREIDKVLLLRTFSTRSPCTFLEPF